MKAPRKRPDLANDRALVADASAQAQTDTDGQTKAAEKAARRAAKAQEKADGQAAKDAEAQDKAAAVAASQAKAAGKAADQTATDAKAQDKADAAAQKRADAEAEAQEKTDGQAAKDAETQDKAADRAADDAEAQAETDAAAAAQAETAGKAADRAATDAEAQDKTDAAAQNGVDAEPDAQDKAPRRAADGAEAHAETDAVAAAQAEAADKATDQSATNADVTTQTVTESGRRSSSEEFLKSDRDGRDSDRRDRDGKDRDGRRDSNSGLSDLETAGLVALGAVAVGAILFSGQRVQSNTGDRVIVLDNDGSYRVLKDDDALLRRPGSQVRTERFDDGSTRTTVLYTDGTRIITIRDFSGRALHRVRIDPDGREYLLIDDTRTFEPVNVRNLPRPRHDDFDYRATTDRESLRQALLAADQRDVGRSFSLRQVREYVEVRELAPEINLEAITFATNSAALQPSQAEELRQMGLLMREFIADDPTELFLIEGHTDAVGDAGHNLLLSDRRAESVALAFSEYFDVPAENMVVQGYGESFLKIPVQYAERLNRRVAVRRITSLVR